MTLKNESKKVNLKSESKEMNLKVTIKRSSFAIQIFATYYCKGIIIRYCKIMPQCLLFSPIFICYYINQ